MKQKDENQYVKRTQKDYSYTFKLSVVEEIERGELGIRAASRKYGIQSHSTITNWLRKYGTFDWYNKTHLNLSKSPEQKLLELEQKVKLLEKQKASLEKKLEFTDKKAIFFDMMIDIAEEELKIPIRKKYSPEQSNDSKNSTKKA
ncbi:helix-turn-helix domain-containing protein [Mangrovivirga cuniculi]|uniref:helix-turn-helix domain-containing protein n=1 Tax=Mangrovivirga cuniculi TaxID=2715131 RepID=UPI001C311A16|nr:helix-turn-helix domain-containing protein [Mangrovivirga cuniculi]